MTYTSLVISGLPGSGKSALSKGLRDILGWKTYSIGDMWREEYNHAKSVGEERSFESWWKAQPLEKQLDVNIKLKELLKIGNLIGESRYGSSYSDIDALLVFITSDLDIRADRAYKMGKYNGISADEIKTILEKREQDELSMGKKLFGQDFDYRDINQYNLVLNSGKLSVGHEVSSIVNIL